MYFIVLIWVFYRLDLIFSLCFFLLERLVVSRGTACRNSITPMLICRVKKKITLVILYIKTRVIEVKPAVPLLTIDRRGHILYSLITSLRILYIGGWNHSDLELSISLLHLRIWTPSLICLLRQSLFVFVTLALNLLTAPWWHCSMCLRVKQDSLSSSPSLCSFLICSFALV